MFFFLRKEIAVKKRVEKAIAKSIILAQVASDGGKNISEIRDILGNDSYYVYGQGYNAKDRYIFSAIELICRNRDTSFHFSVMSGKGVSPYLVYFTFKIDGKRHQVSFHSYNNNLGRYKSKNHMTRWDEKDSRETCVKLAQAYGWGE